MRHDICEQLGIEFPLFAFSHCRDVVAAVSRAGGFGVLGGTRFTADTLEQELAWIDDHVGGMPYGADIIFPEHQSITELPTEDELLAMIPDAHRNFVEAIMQQHGMSFAVDEGLKTIPASVLPELAEKMLDVAFQHPIKLIANALGLAPPTMIEKAKKHGVPVAALVGSKEHAVRQVNAGVDIVVAQGTEAGGHCGEVSTLVLVPEVIRAVQRVRDVPVLAAGGITTGRQMAGMMAVGAAGAWTGSVWLATTESEVSATFREKMIAASSRDTIRSKARTGKLCRQLRSQWHEKWDAPGAPAPLGMPLQGLLAIPALNMAERAADAGKDEARDLVSYYVGQGVGLIENVSSATTVVQDFKNEFADAVIDLQELFG